MRASLRGPARQDGEVLAVAPEGRLRPGALLRRERAIEVEQQREHLLPRGGVGVEEGGVAPALPVRGELGQALLRRAAAHDGKELALQAPAVLVAHAGGERRALRELPY